MAEESTLKSPDLQQLRCATFEPLVGEMFNITIDEKVIEAELIEAKMTSKESDKERLRVVGRLPFSLMFETKGKAPVQQGCYDVSNDKIGTMQILMVPVLPATVEKSVEQQKSLAQSDDNYVEGVNFQAIFS
ncbi:MAG: hypothetical protein HQL54_06875 [Magnetococcales bacterium]|nr:hypothetical protein [Magnetococcales bacterium]